MSVAALRAAHSSHYKSKCCCPYTPLFYLTKLLLICYNVLIKFLIPIFYSGGMLLCAALFAVLKIQK